MNNKRTIIICTIIALIVLSIVIFITFICNLIPFSIILGLFFIVLAVYLYVYIHEEPNDYNIYVKKRKKIFKEYSSNIVEVTEIPPIAKKDIIKVKSFEDLIDAQLELKEPIYYKNDNDSCFFLLLHNNEACIFVLKMNDSIVSPTEEFLNYKKSEKVNDISFSESFLENVENTIIYKLDELRSYKISPIRNEVKIQVIDDTGIKAEFDNKAEKKITTSMIDEELSKTNYLKKLKERMLKYEEELALKQQEEENIAKSKKNSSKNKEPTGNKTEKIPKESSSQQVQKLNENIIIE